MDNKNKPAFPIPAAANETGVYSSYDASGGQHYGGLTKREYIAAMALQGWIASFAGLKESPNVDTAVKRSIEFADALLAEL